MMRGVQHDVCVHRDQRMLGCGEQNVRRLEISMDDALIVGMVDGEGDGAKAANGRMLGHGAAAEKM